MSRLPYMTKNPNDPEHKWDKVQSWITTLIMLVSRNGASEPTPPFGKTPSHEIDAQCDAWVRNLVKQDKVGQKDIPSPKLAPWLFARLLVVKEHISDLIEQHTAAPTHPGGVQEILPELLVDKWHQELHKDWARFTFDGEKLKRDNEMILFRPMNSHWLTGEDAEEDDITTVTWKNLHNFSEMLAAAMCQRVEMKLPFGQTPTPEIDARCDRWFKKFFGSEDSQKLVENSPLDLAPWLAARLVVATGLAFGNMDMNPNPPTEKALWICLRNIVITRWNQSAKQLWPGMYMKEDGKIGFRGDPIVDHLQSKGIFFSMN